MRTALELTNVSKSYQDFKLKDINLKVPKGCIMGFVGKNGAGKTTTIHLILDLIKRESGDIKILGQDNRLHQRDIKEQIGVVLDESCFSDTMTAKNVDKVMKPIYRNWDSGKYFDYLKKFDLPLEKRVKDYSKGMKMKISIAVALSHGAKLLILDEATSGLDPFIRDEILDIFLDFIQDEENTVFISSHIVSDLEKVCDYITLIHQGEIIFSEAKDELLESYGVLKCSRSDLEKVDPDYVISSRENSFSTESLVKKEGMKGDFVIDPASIEDIMLFYLRRGNK